MNKNSQNSFPICFYYGLIATQNLQGDTIESKWFRNIYFQCETRQLCKDCGRKGVTSFGAIFVAPLWYHKIPPENPYRMILSSNTLVWRHSELCRFCCLHICLLLLLFYCLFVAILTRNELSLAHTQFLAKLSGTQLAGYICVFVFLFLYLF